MNIHNHQVWWLLLLLIPAVYFAVLFVVARISLRPPRLPVYLSPGALGAPQESVEFRGRNGVVLRGWWSASEGSDRVAILCHGYVMNRSELTPCVRDLCASGWNCLVFDFPGHGKSGASNCGFGWSERIDVVCAVNWVRERVPNARVALIGSSMGAAASAFAARESKANALVLDSSYSRLTEATKGWWRFIGGKSLALLLAPTVYVTKFMLDFDPRNIDVATALKNLENTDVLVLHGKCDVLAPPAEAERNVRALGRAEVVWFDGCNHSEGRWEHPERYRNALHEFLNRVIPL